MADTKISALTALTGANVDAAADVLAIVDTSVTTTKKILVNELLGGQATTTVFAGATTLLTIGGTGASSVFAIPGTLDASGTTGALTVAGGAYIAKALNVVGITTLSAAIVGAATQSVFNTVSTTVNAFGAASTALNIGNASGTNAVAGATTFSQLMTATLGLKSTIGLSVGGATAGAGGIAFPATAVAVADANTLDDYEEGTWTPVVGGDATYTNQVGNYVKIGKMVTIWGSITINVIGTGSASTISGLPFAAASTGKPQVGAVGYWANLATNALALGMYVNDNASTCSFPASTAAGTTVGAAALDLFGNGTRVDFSATYFI